MDRINTLVEKPRANDMSMELRTSPRWASPGKVAECEIDGRPAKGLWPDQEPLL